MKNLFKPNAVIVTAFIFTLSSNAQEDKIQGIYLDGLRVDTLYCNDFKKMELVFKTPKSMSYPYYTIIEKLRTPKGLKPVDMDIDSKSYNEDYFYWYNRDQIDFSKEMMENHYLNSNYIVFPYKVEGTNKGAYGKAGSIKNGLSAPLHTNCFKYIAFTGLIFAAPAKSKKIKSELDAKGVDYIECEYTASLYGQRLVGFEEEFDSFCNCIKKTAKYDSELLTSIKTVLRLKFISNDKEIETISKTCKKGNKSLENSLKSISATSAAGIAASSGSTLDLKVYTEKHKNGKVKVQGQNNKDGNQEGTWKYFNELGKLERVENYENGISHGEWKYYDTKTGKVTKTEKYNEGELIE